MKILHITPHFGGGVGTVIIDWIINDKKNDHTIFCIDYLNKRIKDEIELSQIDVRHMPVTDMSIYDWSDYDIVLIHWWDHPLLGELLKNETPPCRLIFWCHKNYEIPQREINYPDLFIGTAPCQHLRNYIWSARDMWNFSNHNLIPYPPIESASYMYFNRGIYDFRVGYVGSRKKISENFLYAVAMLPDVEFVFIGMEETRMMRKFKNIYTVGDINDDNLLAKYYGSFDVFGYPLAKNHYGTCEQVIGEAMSAGCVPVVLNNECESFIIQNGLNGFIANSIEDYVNFIKILRDYPAIRASMSFHATSYPSLRYSYKIMIASWNDVFNNMMRRKKRIHK